jgi:hypothetical protein
MLEAMLAVMSSSGVGSLIGGFFGWLSRREDRKTRQADQEHERAMVALRTEAGVQLSEADAFLESQRTISRFADVLKSLVRPAITAVLLAMLAHIMLQLEIITGGVAAFPPEEAARLYREIIPNIIGLTATAVSWWFASRPSSMRQRK